MASAPTDNDESALWQGWLDLHGEVFLLFARQQTRGEDDARDVFQEALVDAWKRAGHRPPDRALVFAQIRRRSIDLARSNERRGRREQIAIGPAEGAMWFCPDFSQGDTRDYLARAVAELPPTLRETLTLKIWGDLTFPEIAQLLEIPVPTATARYRYALDRLRPQLAPLQP